MEAYMNSDNTAPDMSEAWFDHFRTVLRFIISACFLIWWQADHFILIEQKSINLELILSHDPNAGSVNNELNSYLQDRAVLKKMGELPGVKPGIKNAISDMALTGSLRWEKPLILNKTKFWKHNGFNNSSLNKFITCYCSSHEHFLLWSKDYEP